MNSPSNNTFKSCLESIKTLYRKYNVEDIAIALFASCLWLPNIVSPVKHILHNVILCSMEPKDFSGTQRINNYNDFIFFLKELYTQSPGFPLLEDFVPEFDWGDIKFPFNNNKYHIFYNGDLSNIYDYLALFKIIYEPLDSTFKEIINRSPLKEMEIFLKIQDLIITGISSQPDGNTLKVSPGETTIPSESFWQDSVRTYNSLNLESIVGSDILQKYGKELGEFELDLLSDEKFGYILEDNLIFSTMFIKSGGRHFLILPRRITGILFDTWGELLKQCHAYFLEREVILEKKVAGEFCRFVKRRFSKEDSLFFVSAFSDDNKAHEIIFPAAIISKDKIVLFYILPPTKDEETIAINYTEIHPKLEEAIRFISKKPTKLIQHLDNNYVEIRRNDSDEALVPILFVVIPQTYTGPIFPKLQENPLGRVVFMDSILYLLDELDDIDLFSSFLDYIESLDNLDRPTLATLEDLFASFMDSYGVLISGALKPNMVMITPHWGSHFRYKSLVDFWRLYPNRDFMGHPRSWRVLQEGPNRIRLEARNFFGSALYREIGKTTIFLSSPFDEMSYEQAKLSNFMIECVEDNLYCFRKIIEEHRFFSRYDELLILFFPDSLLHSNPNFEHLQHLIPLELPWCADASMLDSQSVGIRFVFSDKAIVDAFSRVSDRSIETLLLLDVIKQVDNICHDSKSQAITEVIENEKGEKPRHKFFVENKLASFPEKVHICLPTPHDFKYAQKRLAELAREAGVSEGNYSLSVAKDKLNLLRKVMFTEINKVVARFDFVNSIPKLIGWVDAVIDRREREQLKIKRSFEHEVDYLREESYTKSEEEYLKNYIPYRYLIEKFVQLRPEGSEIVSEDSTKSLIALVDTLIWISSTSDIIHYDINPVGLKINHDFIVEAELTESEKAQQIQFMQEQSAIRLGTAGNRQDKLNNPLSTDELIASFDDAFINDYGLKISSVLDTLYVLTFWPNYNEGLLEAQNYLATNEEILSSLKNIIEEISLDKVDQILDFLTLKTEEVLFLIKDDSPCDDLPIWENHKRFARFAIKPLIKINDKYLWGPYSVRNANILWVNYLSSCSLPADIGKSNINNLLNRLKQNLDNALEKKTADIVKRYTPHIIPNAKLHRLDRSGNHPEDLGDYDVLAYLPQSNSILNIECKNLLSVFCPKDMKTLRETIFGIPGKNNGHFRQINKRQEYLVANWSAIFKTLKWPLNQEKPPEVISLYVTPKTYWWTRFPPSDVVTIFLQIELLSTFINNLINNN
jgi:hypothetical protein